MEAEIGVMPPQAEACQGVPAPSSSRERHKGCSLEASEGTSSVNTLSSDFPPPELWGDKCRSKPPRLRHFVTAALGFDTSRLSFPFQAFSAPVLPRSDCLERQVRRGEGTCYRGSGVGSGR